MAALSSSPQSIGDALEAVGLLCSFGGFTSPCHGYIVVASDRNNSRGRLGDQNHNRTAVVANVVVSRYAGGIPVVCPGRQKHELGSREAGG